MRKQVLAISACLSVWGSMLAVPAQANLTPYESRLSVSFTESTSGTGASRSIEFTATVNDSGSDLMMHTNPTGSQVRVEGLVVFMCTSAQPSSSLGYLPPTGCVFFSGTASSNIGSASSWTFSRTYSGQEFDNRISTHPFVVPTLHFKDASNNQLGIHGSVVVQTLASSTLESPPPAKYSGPEFSGLSAKPVAVGSSSVLEGKRLNEVSSITIGGKSATFTATATELKLDVPKDLAPGLYDLVIHSAAGKLTQINAVRVQGPLTALSVTTVSEGRISSEQLHEHALIAAMQQPELTKARCIVNGPNLAQAKAQAERLCALVRASNKNIETTVVESRSTVKNNKVYARVSYGWN
jgi:hypothetical protein